jgi:hypothetical protein
MSNESYRRLVAIVLAGFPFVLVLSWLYDIRLGRIQRTHSAHQSRGLRLLIWGALAIVVGGAVILAGLLLRGL